MKKAMFCLLGGSLLWCGTAWPATGAEENPLMTLRREHPRLMLARADWDALRMRTTHEPVARQMLQDLCAEADRILKDAPIEHKLIGPGYFTSTRPVRKIWPSISPMQARIAGRVPPCSGWRARFISRCMRPIIF